MSNELKAATETVDEAWEYWKENPSLEAEAAYDAAYERWKTLGRSRGVGRPPSGEQSALTSSERARAARGRQQQSASQWEKVAPLIQNLRRAHQSNDFEEIARIVDTMVKETCMVLKNFNVVHAQPDSDQVVLHCWHNDEMVLAFIPKIHLEDNLRCDRLTGKQANLLVQSNLDAISKIVSAKFERGEFRPYSRFGSTIPRVDLVPADIEKNGIKLNENILNGTAGWASAEGCLSTK